MRRIDVLTIGLVAFLAGGGIYLAFRQFGLDSQDAGIWSQVLLVVGLVAYLSTYLLRAVSHKMTYNQQLKDYEEAVLAKRLAEMSPEELAQLQTEVEAERQKQSDSASPPELHSPG
ncbi:DUF3007 family protein [Leptolyngbya sp. FACHB-261]|uniref:DUF3007 family protein n=1 Tax=Leptolyngbya sp. FACHB-261 TaxID=2692806 RepID=UPI00168283C4|nr:DUF3007 family protein [Leptolyngbya sp. FACHB-261]MBD2104360.1 DUF3007 family protein [Leptolyngbya sp. FACHB-261]